MERTPVTSPFGSRSGVLLQWQDPADLPQCEWFGRNCDYAAICRCDTAPALTRVVPTEGCRIARDGVRATRRLIQELGLEATDEAMRAFRC